MSLYVGALGLNTFQDEIDDAVDTLASSIAIDINHTSNYVLITSNILVKEITDEIEHTSNYVLSTSNVFVTEIKNTSNYIYSSSNILIQRIQELEDRVDDLEGAEGSVGDPDADPPIPPIPPTGNYAILATLGVLTAGATATGILIDDLYDKVNNNAIYGSNYSDKVGIWGSNYE